ncbi:MAG: nucleotidyltransferase domain-containing protein [Betaproteobacteria bacterium]|nr:nucleotidyltransferase domain-containing protein [Candidatus Dechloromonas phosphorivorans]
MGITKHSLSDVLFLKAQQRVLGLLIAQPERSFFANEIVRLAATGTGAIHRELERLTAAGLLKESRVGNQRHFQANREAPIFEELRSIVLKTFGLVDVLREVLLPLAARIRVAFIYGSIARREDSASSDIDLMLISDELAYPDLYAVLAEAEARLGRPVNPTVYKSAELTQKMAEGNAFASRVLSQEKLFVLGSQDDLPESA